MKVSELIFYLGELTDQDAEVVVYAPTVRGDRQVRHVSDVGHFGFYKPDRSWKGAVQETGEWAWSLDGFGSAEAGDQDGAVPAVYLFTGDEPPKDSD